MPIRHHLNVAVVTSNLKEQINDIPDGPCVVLTGTKEAVKAAAQFFDEEVVLEPCNPKE